MEEIDKERVATLLTQACAGEELATQDLLGVVYHDLRGVASRLLAAERANHTLQPTALVHEAWLRLVDQSCVGGDSENAERRFIGLAAQAMRRVLVDHARRRGRDKRGGGREQIPLPDGLPIASADADTILDLEASLQEMARTSARLAAIAELRVFGGLSSAEVASILEVSLATVKADWALAQAILTRRLRSGGAEQA